MNGMTDMQTIIGTIVYLNDCAFDTEFKCPFLYVNRYEKYKLENVGAKLDVEKYDNVKVEVTGILHNDMIQVETIYNV